MTAAELRFLLVGAGIPAYQVNFLLADESYEPCSIDFVTANWDAWLQARPIELVVTRNIAGKTVRVRPRWLEESSDCDNLAIGTMAWASVGNALKAARAGTKRGGLAYGVMFYRSSQGPHAINWFVDLSLNVRFFEPGLGCELFLLPAEKASTWFGLAA